MEDGLIPVITADGSTTILNTRLGEHYHSTHGAETESLHVFIRNGLEHCLRERNNLRILEVGFGTGLNLCLTAYMSLNNRGAVIGYTGIEAFPLPLSLIELLRFNVLNQEGMMAIYREIHARPWNTPFRLLPGLTVEKIKCEFRHYAVPEPFDLVYYDAFAPAYQPEMWGRESAEAISGLMRKDSVFVTYCAQGRFRRLLQSCGLVVERLPEIGRAHV